VRLEEHNKRRPPCPKWSHDRSYIRRGACRLSARKYYRSPVVFRLLFSSTRSYNLVRGAYLPCLEQARGLGYRAAQHKVFMRTWGQVDGLLATSVVGPQLDMARGLFGRRTSLDSSAFARFAWISIIYHGWTGVLCIRPLCNLPVFATPLRRPGPLGHLLIRAHTYPRWQQLHYTISLLVL
jgi:hypothetical protein